MAKANQEIKYRFATKEQSLKKIDRHFILPDEVVAIIGSGDNIRKCYVFLRYHAEPFEIHNMTATEIKEALEG